jgi:histidinol-phosphatase (PHP family)
VPTCPQQGLTPEDLFETFSSYVTEAVRLKKAYASQISLLVGLETEFITALDLDRLSLLLESHPDSFDYVVGSVHHVAEVPIDFDPVTFTRALEKCNGGLPTLASAYLDHQFAILEKFEPEIVGHFDLCRLYHPDWDLRADPEVWGKVERNVRYAIGYGALFEVNAAAFRKGWQTAYPGPEVLDVRFSAQCSLLFPGSNC